jgi:heat shock protein HslJ
MRSKIFRLILIGLLTFGGLTAVAAQAENELAGTQWQLISMTGTPLPDEVYITLQFNADAQASGMGGCNGFSATYTLDGDAIHLTDIVSTLMACDQLDYEVAYFAALQAVARYDRADDQLTLSTADEQQLVFRALPTLPGTDWQLIWLDGAEVLGDTPLTLTFNKDGSVQGSGGCNQFSSQYALNGDTLTFEGIRSTRRACAADDLNAQEQAYFAVLEAAANYTISGDHLMVIAQDGRMLRFARRANLVETSWQLDSIDGTVVTGTVTLQFTDETTVSGSGGCNQYSGSYTVNGEEISFGELVSTERACLESNLMEQEGGFYAALDAATGYQVSDEQLIIIYGDEQQLVFSSAATISSN